LIFSIGTEARTQKAYRENRQPPGCRGGDATVTIFGTDMSHYDQAPADLGARLVAEGVSFATHQGGGDATDIKLGDWWQSVKGQRGKLLLGAYWVLYPGSPVTRANSFVARLDAACPGWRDGPFILQADCEKWNDDSSTVPSKANIQAFCDRLRVLAPKLMPIVYAPLWVYGGTLKGLTYPLWASSYVNGSGSASQLYPSDISTRWSPYSGQSPAILQFTSSATIAGMTTCDANAYRGTLAELTALLAPGWKTEVPDVELTDKYGDAAYAGRTVQDRLSDDAKLRDVLWGDKTGTAAAKLDPASPLAKLIATPTAVAALSAKVDQLSAAVAAGQGGFTQEQLDTAVLNALKAAFGGQA
jgi:hypothetical protein